MLIGLDFDNTIVCYDNAIGVLAEKTLNLPSNISRTKVALRDFLRQEDREEEWTIFQGELYGPGMTYAEPFPYVIPVLKNLVRLGHDLVIVSHRSKKPYAGEPHDLHFYAQQWVSKNLRSHGLFNDSPNRSSVHFHETKIEKIQKISTLKCSVFVDDLPEIFLHKDFPQGVKSFLFNCEDHSMKTSKKPFLFLDCWKDLPELICDH